MVTIIQKDALRARIEAASEGRRTVLYTASGQPSYMYMIPAFTMNQVATDLGHELHPAFRCREKTINAFFYGCYPGSLHNGELLSLPDQQPATGYDLASFRQFARRNGQGWHISTNAEWSALMFLCRQQNMAEAGNTDYGAYHASSQQYGQRIAGNIGEQQGDPVTLTASGPAAWYHDGTRNGIGDLCGNVWEWQEGARLQRGEIQIIRDNNAAFQPDDMDWEAIDLLSGALIPSGSSQSAKYDSPLAHRLGNAGTPIISANIRHFNGDPQDNNNPPGLLDGPFNDIRCETGLSTPALLQILGFSPWHQQQDNDQVYLRNYGERALLRGGAWYSRELAGMRTLCLSHTASHKSATVGARPVFIG